MPRYYRLSYIIIIGFAATCGCGGSGNSGNLTFTGIVVTGDSNAISDTNGATGLQPVGAGVSVPILREEAGSSGFGIQATPKTDAQGRFTVSIPKSHSYGYFVVLKDTCSNTVVFNADANETGISIYPDHSTYNYNHASPAMYTKADVAAQALGVDGVVIMGTGSGTCSN